ncbi:MAG TPA: hypothetical protein PK431_02345 [Chitinophagales bacterium]|nr:hypothetical protein [Chitinophagales bacterium]
MENLKFTRRELYDLVWSMSIRAIAARYTVSESEISTACKNFNIPTPLNGHWTKLQFNKPVTIISLPDKENENQEIIFKSKINESGIIEKELSPLKTQQLEIENHLQAKLILPQKLSNPDKLIIAAKDELTRKDKYVDNGLVSCRYEGLDIKVSKQNISRALLIMDTLIKALQARNHEIKINNRETYVVIMKQEVELSLREKTKKVPNTRSNWPDNDYIPTGIFILRIDRRWRGKEFTDGKLQIEKQLSVIIANLELMALEEIRRDIESDKRKIEEAILEKTRKNFEKRQDDDLAAFRQTLKNAKRWHKAVNLRNYINEVETKAIENNTLTDEIKTWLIWARKKEDWYDPFIESKDELLNGVDKETLTINRKPSYW